MTTISPVATARAHAAAPIAEETAAASGKAFPQALKSLQTPASWLTTSDAANAHRPNIKGFMDLTGASFTDASELLYGVIGSNTDVRNWAGIMASTDPITAARQATAQMYGRAEVTARADAAYLGDQDTIARAGNFGLRQLKEDDQKISDQGLKLVDAQGLILRDAGSSPEQIARNAWLFGFDTQPLSALVQPAQRLSNDLSQAIAKAAQQPAQVPKATPLVPTAHALQAPSASDQFINELATPGNTQNAAVEPPEKLARTLNADTSVTALLQDITDSLAPIEDSALQAAQPGHLQTPTSGTESITPVIDQWLNASQAAKYVDSIQILNQLFTGAEEQRADS